MYKLKDIKRDDFKEISIVNQKEIINRTGNPLVLEKGYDLLKTHTRNFTIDDPLAKEADQLLDQILKTHNKTLKTDKEVTPIFSLSKEAILIRENERVRVLKLKLKLKSKSA